ncbi:hypothetical protein FOCC_FOCC001757, partial [Frankliniella occidentalis]
CRFPRIGRNQITEVDFLSFDRQPAVGIKTSLATLPTWHRAGGATLEDMTCTGAVMSAYEESEKEKAWVETIEKNTRFVPFYYQSQEKGCQRINIKVKLTGYKGDAEKLKLQAKLLDANKDERQFDMKIENQDWKNLKTSEPGVLSGRITFRLVLAPKQPRKEPRKEIRKETRKETRKQARKQPITGLARAKRSKNQHILYLFLYVQERESKHIVAQLRSGPILDSTSPFFSDFKIEKIIPRNCSEGEIVICKKGPFTEDVKVAFIKKDSPETESVFSISDKTFIQKRGKDAIVRFNNALSGGTYKVELRRTIHIDNFEPFDQVSRESLEIYVKPEENCAHEDDRPSTASASTTDLHPALSGTQYFTTEMHTNYALCCVLLVNCGVRQLLFVTVMSRPVRDQTCRVFLPIVIRYKQM